MDKSRPRDKELEKSRELPQDLIIETKVSKVRRIIEVIISLIFWIIIVFFLSFTIDSFIFKRGGFHLFYAYIPDFIAETNYLATIFFVLLEVSLFILALLWIYFNRMLYKYRGKKNKRLRELPYVNEKEISSYFQLPLEEMNRRQVEDELVIYEEENIDNTQMKILREQYKSNQP